MELESTNWQGALRLAAELGHHRLVIGTMDSLQWVVDTSTPWGQWDELYTLSIASARAVTDRQAEAEHLYNLTVVYDRTVNDADELSRVTALLTDLADELADPRLRGLALMARSTVSRNSGDYTEALARAEAAAELLRGRDWPEYCQAITQCGSANYLAGEHQTAVAQHQLILDVLRDHAAELPQGFVDGQSFRTYGEIGLNQARLGRWTESLAAFERAASICGRIGNPAHQGRLLRHAAKAQAQLGRSEEASVTSETAIRLLLAAGHEEIAEQARQEMLSI